jgi:hypothetical protein
MTVDLGSITSNNIDEWLWRIKALQLAINDDSFYKTLDKDTLTKCIGFKTNVVTATRTAYKKRLSNMLEQTVDSLMRVHGK